MSGIARVILADRTGLLRAETAARLEFVSERLNNYGKARLVFSRSDRTAAADLLQFGGRVLIQFDNGLPDWGGVFEFPRRWGDGDIEVTVYCGAYLLTMRRTDKAKYFSSATVGEIFSAVIADANAAGHLGITTGSVWNGGDRHSPDYHLISLFDIVQKSVCGRLSDAEFDVIPVVANGRLSFIANLYERRGADKFNTALLSGHNCHIRSFDERGPMQNEINLAGADTSVSGNGWGNGRLIAQSRDQQSINQYGLRQYSEVHGGVTQQTTLDSSADSILNSRHQPHAIFDLTAFNLKPALFSAYGVGDTVTAWLYNYGFSGTAAQVRVYGRSFTPANGSVSLIVREC